MERTYLSDAQWGVIWPFLVNHPRVYVGNPLTCRAFLEAVLWVLRSGSQWRLLPASRGNWNSVFKRFARWQQRGLWAELQAHVASDPDWEHLLIDSTVVRAHPCAAGAEKSSAEAEALGRSRGGFSTKIHALTDALGNPLTLVLTGGQAADIGQAERLIGTYSGHAVIGDKGYDSDTFVTFVEERGMEAVIPPRSHRKTPRTYDRHVYKERHLVECFFNKIKHYRRIFSRFEKTAKHFMAFLHFVAFLVWTR
ncbi:MAG: IS5 family transposase [Candidatus Competibacteraceae bacterium]|nr:IS5 family transposase [Candidatus Competibacteraceae bacterium]